MHTSQGNRGSEEEKLPPRARWVERVCGHLPDLYPPQHQAPVIAARPCPGLQPVRVKESAVGNSGSLTIYQGQTQGSSKTAEMHGGIKQACQQCKARHKITPTSDSFPTPDIRTSHHICCYLSKFTGRSVLRFPRTKTKGVLDSPLGPARQPCLPVYSLLHFIGKTSSVTIPKARVWKETHKNKHFPPKHS